jgi:hypothetical protein
MVSSVSLFIVATVCLGTRGDGSVASQENTQQVSSLPNLRTAARSPLKSMSPSRGAARSPFRGTSGSPPRGAARSTFASRSKSSLTHSERREPLKELTTLPAKHPGMQKTQGQPSPTGKAPTSSYEAGVRKSPVDKTEIEAAVEKMQEAAAKARGRVESITSSQGSATSPASVTSRLYESPPPNPLGRASQHKVSPRLGVPPLNERGSLGSWSERGFSPALKERDSLSERRSSSGEVRQLWPKVASPTPPTDRPAAVKTHPGKEVVNSMIGKDSDWELREKIPRRARSVSSAKSPLPARAFTLGQPIPSLDDLSQQSDARVFEVASAEIWRGSEHRRPRGEYIDLSEVISKDAHSGGRSSRSSSRELKESPGRSRRSSSRTPPRERSDTDGDSYRGKRIDRGRSRSLEELPR